MVKNLHRWIAALSLMILFATVGVARAGDDKADRDRKARAALALAEPPKEVHDRKARVAVALAAADPAPVLAPAPKPKFCPCGDACKCAGACPACPAIKRDVARVRDAVVRVRCGNASGSGTVIWSEGGRSVVLTAAHVVAGGEPVTVRGDGKTHPAAVLGRDERADLAALLVAADLFAVRVSEADPAAGAEVLMVGLTSLWSKGTIGKGYELNGAAIWELTYDSDSGDSGAGVFVAGELVGVHCGKVGAPGTPYCASAKPVRAFLARILKREGKRTVLVVPVPMPALKVAPPVEKKIVGFRCEIVNGRRVCVPVYEP